MIKNRRKLAARIGAAAVLLCLLLGLCACAAPQTEPAQGEKLKVVTTIFPPYDFARQLGGNLVEVTMLAAPGTEAHDFVPTLTDVDALAQCDLFLYVGGTTDAWAQSALESLGDAAPRAVAMCDLVDTVEEQPLEGMEPEHGEHGEDETDEHVWTSPRNAIAICKGIAAAMQELDPDNQAAYAAGCGRYCSQLETLDQAFAEVMAGSVRRTVVFADRFPFRYLADELGLTCYAAFAGCSSDTEPSLATLAFLTEKVQSERLPVVFYVEFSDQTLADTICAATGAQKLLLHSCHNVSPEEFAAGVTYLDLMNRNVENLRTAVQTASP